MLLAPAAQPLLPGLTGGVRPVAQDLRHARIGHRNREVALKVIEKMGLATNPEVVASFRDSGTNTDLNSWLVENLLLLLAPMAPYLTEEQWHRNGHEGSIHFETWPTFDPALAARDEVTMVVQVNGKVRDTIEVSADISEDEMKERALSSEKIKGHLNGGEPDKIIVRPPKLVNLVVR
mgnify:CR=1 FL=1